MPGINDDSIERQELYCHNCDKYVQFSIDLALDGNHVLNCPSCDHEHCRVVKNGKITDIRWDTRNGVSTYMVTNVYSTQVALSSTASNTVYLYGSMMTSGTGGYY